MKKSNGFKINYMASIHIVVGLSFITEMILVRKLYKIEIRTIYHRFDGVLHLLYTVVFTAVLKPSF